jgi:rSAM/selenodomain-associated transferase 2
MPTSLPLRDASTARVQLSIVVPVLDEAAIVEPALRALAPLRAEGVEVVVVDGGSRDGTPALAAPWADAVVAAPRGRAAQMNAGARRASGTALLFLHVDTALPADAAALVATALQAPAEGAGRAASWGRFDVRISGRRRLLGLVGRLMNLRSRLTGIATGDQAIFMTRAAFDAVGGFPEQPLMEDIELSRRLRRLGPPACLRARVTTSGRRWETRGIWRTIVLMWRLRLLYAVGVAPERLARSYR